jgi:hypothetical protein
MIGHTRGVFDGELVISVYGQSVNPKFLYLFRNRRTEPIVTPDRISVPD